MAGGGRPSREGVAYSGGSSLGVPFPADHDDDERDDQAPDDHAPADDDDAGADDGDGGQGGGRRPVSFPGSGGLAGAGAGWVLGLLLWGWVVLPFVRGGPAGVGKVLRAKFMNQAPDGSPLP